MDTALASSPTRGASSVLLVEDSSADAHLVIRTLEASAVLEAQVEVVGSLAEATQLLAARRYDAVLLDLGLPDAQGLGALAALRARGLKTPIIVVTGNTESSLGPRAVRSGAQDYILKTDLGTALMPRAVRYAIERSSVEREAREAHKRESLSLLAQGVAHQFNNLLSVIMGHAAIALMQDRIDAATRQRLNAIATAAERAAEVSRSALAYSGGATLGHSPHDFNEIVRASVQEARVDQGGGPVRASLAPDLDPIDVDRGQVALAVRALLRNAFEAVDGEAHRVHVRTYRAQFDGMDSASWLLPLKAPDPGSYVCLDVEDDGGGIPQGIRDHIFEPGMTSKGVGRGFGLGYVLGAVDAHGGRVGVRHLSRERVQFRVWLPAWVSTEAGERPRITKQGRASRVLVVDEEAKVSSVVSAALAELGYDVHVGRGGLDGLRLWQQHRDEIDAVVLECSMQRVEGRHVLDVIRSIDVHLPVVLTTGGGFDPALRGDGSGATTFLHKPFTPDELRTRLEALGVPGPMA